MRLVMEGLTSRWVEDDQNYVGVFRLYLHFFPPQTPFLTIEEQVRNKNTIRVGRRG